ncbi:acyltransferase domain-containing protein [Embleya hyalina]|uniref:[acyl-carrier-protein] S-malonyltransferase n=1 Tax=Embleya hyalina TaxID=516124 RepID=A0A401Z540_9ACTN|nr:acyltransferase domain-containing protein [Embleya hyalina]GCE01955.1 polyketide synthase [Embleya hyalina]
MGDGTAFLFPGQGAYLESVFTELRRHRVEVAEVFAEIDASVAGSDHVAPISPILLRDAPPTLDTLLDTDPDTLQLALYGTSLAIHRILTAEGVKPAVLVGHSLGEIAALVAAGAFGVGEGAVVVARRSAALRSAAGPGTDTGAGGMLALGAGVRRVLGLVEFVGAAGLVVAVENSPRQTVVSGPEAALAPVHDIARRAGIESVRVRSPYPFHGPLLAAAADAFHRDIRDLRRSWFRLPVYSPILGRHYTDEDDLGSLLASHLTRRVHFLGALRHLHDTGTDVFVECGARNTLTRLVRKSLPEVNAIACTVAGRSPVVSLREAVDELRGGPATSPSPVGEHASTADVPAAHVPIPDVPAVSDTSRVPAPPLDRAGVIDGITRMYARAVEYPEEVFTEDVELEADLGIDSVKQTELLARVAEQYGLPELTADFRIGRYGTLGRIADLVITHGSGVPVPA